MPSSQDLYRALVLAEPTLHGYYLLNEAAGLPPDQDGTYNITAVTGVPVYGQAGPFDGAGAIRFGATNAYFTSAFVGESIGDICLALEFWIKVASVPSTFVVIVNGINYALCLTSAGKLQVLAQFIGFGGSTATSVDDGNWHYVLGTRSGDGQGDFNVYIDGVADANNPLLHLTGIATPYFDQFLGVSNGSNDSQVTLSNVAIYRDCPNPAQHYPPPTPTNVQLPYLGVGP